MSVGRVAHGAHRRLLVGRRAELAALVEAVTRATRLVLVEGEAGVGKSRLVRELLGSVSSPGLTIVTAVCRPVTSQPGPVAEAVQRVAGRAGLSPGGAGCADTAVHANVLETLDALGRCLLVVDETQWVDRDTIDLLRFLASAELPGLTVLLAVRPHEFRRVDSPPLAALHRGAGHDVAHLVLAPLTQSAVGELATAVLGTAVRPEFAAELWRRTAGLPLEVMAVLRALGDEPAALDRAGGELAALDRVGVPACLRDATLDRVTRLGRPVTAVCRAVAVLDVPAGEDDIGAVAGLPQRVVADAVCAALDADVLREVRPGRYFLRHPLAACAVHESIPGPRRRELHGRAANQLAADGDASLVRLARHYRYSDDLPRWVRCTVAAVDRASADGDAAAAIAVLEQALDDDLPVAAKEILALRLSREMLNGIATQETIDRLRAVLRDWPLIRAVRGEIRMNLGRVLINQAGEVAEGQRQIERALNELSDRRPVAALGLAALALPHTGVVPVERNLRWLAEAERVCVGSSDNEMLAAMRAYRMTARDKVAEPGAWHAVADLPTATPSPGVRRQLARTYLNLADAAVWNGHFEPARGHLDAARVLIADPPAPYLSALAVGTELRLDAVTGRWDGLAERTARLISTVGAMGYLAADALLALAWLEIGQFRLGPALRAFEAAGAAAPGHLPIQTASHAGRARVLLARGEVEAAGAAAATGLDLARQKGNWVWAADLMPVAVDALVRGGRGDAAHDLVAEFQEGIQDRDAPLAVAAARLVRAALVRADGDTSQASALFAAAGSSYRALPCPHAAASAVESAGLCAAEAGDSDTAVSLLRTAEAEFAGLNADADAHRCRREMRRHDPRRPRRGRIGYGNALSPREQEVAALAADGLTNRQIAAQLVISPRTVELHMARVLHKLDIPSRAMLPGRLG